MTRWEMNDGLYMLLMWAVDAVGASRELTGDALHMVTRRLIAVLVSGWILYCAWRLPKSGREYCERALWTVAAVFLFSPTQFPWYYIWVLPLVALAPRMCCSRVCKVRQNPRLPSASVVCPMSRPGIFRTSF